MIQYQLPFQSQYWDLARWQDQGFASYEEAEYWQNSSCGILCLNMVLERNVRVPISEIIAKGKSINAYTHATGWSHSGLVQLAKEYGIDAYQKEHMSLQEIENILERGNVVIASIKWAFEPTKSLKEKIFFWKKKGGHLALITGYDSEGVYVHHTSILPEYNWENRLIPKTIFLKGFTGRGIILSL